MKKTLLAVLLLTLAPAQAKALDTTELLSLVAMPLAVAAVSEVTGVPAADLSNLITSLNRADVPPRQFVEVIRYAPVALVVETESPQFVQFVRTQVDDGVRGTALVNLIEQRLRTFDVQPQIALVPSSQTIVVDGNFIPPAVRTRVARVRSSHPHGGPPGQLKKVAGVQTGAEIVHGRNRGRSDSVGRSNDDDDRGKDKNKIKSDGRGDDNSGKGNGKGNKGEGKGKG